jgi:glucose-6-phosphate 1-epimerase
VVIWNPWQEKAQELKDMPNDGYQDMLCAETAITQNPQLASGQTHTLTQIISPN